MMKLQAFFAIIDQGKEVVKKTIEKCFGALLFFHKKKFV